MSTSISAVCGWEAAQATGQTPDLALRQLTRPSRRSLDRSAINFAVLHGLIDPKFEAE
jgi:hypothetical protein